MTRPQSLHDPGSGTLAPESGTVPRSAGGDRDALSHVLRAMRLEGALFFLVDVSSPWCIEVPPAGDFADLILPRARHVVSYHIAVEGRGRAALAGGGEVRFDTGDVLVFPHADGYRISDEAGSRPLFDRDGVLDFFRDLAAGKLPFVIPEGGGGMPRARFLCGYLGCDFLPSNPLFRSLPRMIHIRHGPAGDLLDNLIPLALAELQSDGAGGASMRLGLSELMFAEVLRRHAAGLGAGATGWLAGLRDPVTARALDALHGDPGRDWTLAELARTVGASRSVLAERFSRQVGQSPMRYLGDWRIHLAARRLSDGAEPVADVAAQVGYASEAAFSRAFKRVTGLPPGAWRRQSAAVRV